MIPAEWLVHAQSVLADWIVRTPVTHDPELQAFFKWENRQLTGSFKIRGAINKIAALLPWERETGLVTASAGNHGQGVAYAAREFNTAAVVFVSSHASPSKIQSMKDLGATIQLVEGDYTQAEEVGLEFARESGFTWISPYNDSRVIAGQATIGYELADQIHPFDVRSVVVPVGGGGLISGIGLALKSKGLHPQLIGVQPENAAVMSAVFQGKDQFAVVETDTLADGLTGRIEEGSITVPLVRQLVDEIVLVNEAGIEGAVRFAWQKFGEMIEGSAAVVLAALLQGKIPRLPAALVISGGNIQPELHATIVNKPDSDLTGEAAK